MTLAIELQELVRELEDAGLVDEAMRGAEALRLLRRNGSDWAQAKAWRDEAEGLLARRKAASC